MGFEDFLFAYEHLAVSVAVNGLLALSLWCVLAMGQLSLGQAGFMAIGAYAGALLSLNGQLPFVLTLLISASFGGMVAAAVGSLVHRLAGVYLAITTIALGEILRIILVNSSWSGGGTGLSNIPRLTSLPQLYLILAVVLIGLTLVASTRLGRAMEAMRLDETAAAAMGISTGRMKIGGMVASGILAGLAGGLSSHANSFISPQDFGFESAVAILSFVLLGGVQTPLGGVLGAVILTLLPEVFRSIPEARLMINGAVIVLVVLFMPRGILAMRLRRSSRAGQGG
ncbi:MAG: branched-chain amino acid ABC transporter permease [Alphaproteobacteria bacterium]|nr:branched-chain amino acid ABC transporter permease [Alphaproteobacteria bacterium]